MAVIDKKTVLLVLLLYGGFCFANPSSAIPEPVLEGDEVPIPTFGDARSVELLGGLLAEKDPRVRERAAGELGQTHNLAALPRLQQAAKDASSAVRAAAIRGATELGLAGREIILAGLRDTHDAPLLAAMDGLVALRLQDAADALQPLTRHEREEIRFTALRTLTALRRAATPADLKALLDEKNSSSSDILVEALRNALLLESAGERQSDFTRLAEAPQPPVVRAAAVECLGKFVSAVPTTRPAEPEKFENVGKDPNPLLRRAVVRVYRQREAPGNIVPFLSDPSGLVRLAAAEALGDLPTLEALGPLVRVFLNAPDDRMHAAAFRALRRIGGAPVGQAVADHLRRIQADQKTNNDALADVVKQLSKLAEAKPAEKKNTKTIDPEITHRTEALQNRKETLQRRRELLQRNVISCCRLLGVLRRKEGFDELLRLTTALPIDSPLLGEVAAALGRIGDPRAVEPLRAVLDRCSRQALPYLKALTRMVIPPPFSEKITGQVIQALAALGDTESLNATLRLMRLYVSRKRLETVIAFALESLPSLTPAERRSDVEAVVVALLKDRDLFLSIQWRAVKTAGRMKFHSALPLLKRILYQRRECPAMMTVAAWAMQRITGSKQPPMIPEPVLHEGTTWIITQVAG
ncbi:MAG: HEAT repeat domain-containing protein [Phycisphaerae bacterium]|nr:HEAT repeat domain-containing protein [Phycisphaerae bacterium]